MEFLKAYGNIETSEKEFKSVRENRPFCIKESVEARDFFLEQLGLKKIEDIFSIWNRPVDAYSSGLKDESNSQTVDLIEANNLYSDKKTSLLFNDANEVFSELNGPLRGLAEQWGLSQMTIARNLIYITPEGRGTDTHFDQNYNLVVQLFGEKKWKIAGNESIINPLSRYALGSEMDPEMMNYLEENIPDSMPENYTEYSLCPGDVLFVPRGHWHSTEATSDSLALNFTYSAPTRMELLLAVLRARMIQAPAWRETAWTHNNEGQQDEFEVLIRGLEAESEHWSAGEIMDLIEWQKERAAD